MLWTNSQTSVKHTVSLIIKTKSDILDVLRGEFKSSSIEGEDKDLLYDYMLGLLYKSCLINYQDLTPYTFGNAVMSVVRKYNMKMSECVEGTFIKRGFEDNSEDAKLLLSMRDSEESETLDNDEDEGEEIDDDDYYSDDNSDDEDYEDE